MSADASIMLNWGGEERKFRLAIGQLRELQETVNRPRVTMGAPPIGPRTLLRILMEGDAWPDEVREVIRLGLIGGGEKIELVPGLVRRYVDERPILESCQVAQAILLIALAGAPDDHVGQKKTPQATETTTEILRSASPPSTAPDAPSDSPQSKSTGSRSGSSPPASTGSTKRTARNRVPATP